MISGYTEQTNFRILREMLPEISEREWQVLSLRVRGITCKETGARLGLSVKTIDTYQRNLLRKLRVENVPQLIHLCYAAGAIKFLENS